MSEEQIWRRKIKNKCFICFYKEMHQTLYSVHARHLSQLLVSRVRFTRSRCFLLFLLMRHGVTVNLLFYK
jgi:hypothetical protein